MQTLAKPNAAAVAGLPDMGASRLRRLGDVRSATRAATLAASDRCNEQNQARQNAEQTIQRQTSAFRLKPDTDNPEIVRLRGIVDAATTEAARLAAIRDKLGEASQAAGRTADACERWVMEAATGGNVFEAVSPPATSGTCGAPGSNLQRGRRTPRSSPRKPDCSNCASASASGC